MESAIFFIDYNQNFDFFQSMGSLINLNYFSTIVYCSKKNSRIFFVTFKSLYDPQTCYPQKRVLDVLSASDKKNCT